MPMSSLIFLLAILVCLTLGLGALVMVAFWVFIACAQKTLAMFQSMVRR